MNAREILAALEGVHAALELDDPGEARKRLAMLGEAIRKDLPGPKAERKGKMPMQIRPAFTPPPGPIRANPGLPAPWEGASTWDREKDERLSRLNR